MARTFALTIVRDICDMIGIKKRQQEDGQYFSRQELVRLHGFVSAGYQRRKTLEGMKGDSNADTKEKKETEGYVTAETKEEESGGVPVKHISVRYSSPQKK